MENDTSIHRDLLSGPSIFHMDTPLQLPGDPPLEHRYDELDRVAKFLDETPDPILKITRRGAITYANPSGLALLRLWQGAGAEVHVPAPGDLVEMALESGSRLDREVKFDGRIYSLAIIPSAESGTAYVYGRDITEKRHIDDALKRRDAILQAVAVSAERFLGAGDWQAHIAEVLQHLGTATGASRVYIYANAILPEGKRVLEMRHEWLADTVSPCENRMEHISLKEIGLGRWEEMLEQGYIISGSINAFPPDERAVLAAWQTRSIVTIPIFIGQQWWGTISFDECLSDRDWDPREVEALKAATRILSSAIQHTRVQGDLQQQKEFTRLVIDTDPNLIYVKDAAGRFVLANQATSDLYGVNADEIVGLNNWNLHSVPEEVMTYQESDREVLRSRNAIAVREQYTRPDGRVLWFETVKKPLVQPDGVVHVLGISNDITERRRAELVLRNREHQQGAVAKLGLHALAGEGVTALMNRALGMLREMLGVDLAGIWEVSNDGSSVSLCTGLGWKENAVGEWSVIRETRSPMEFVLQVKVPVIVGDWDNEPRFVRPGIIADHDIRSGIYVLIPGKTQPLGVMSAYTTVLRSFTEDDINFMQAVANVLAYAIEWKESEKALRESEGRYRIVAETATDAILTVDQDNRIIFANHSAEAVFGYSMPEILWQDLRMLVSDSIEQIRHKAGQSGASQDAATHDGSAGDGPAEDGPAEDGAASQDAARQDAARQDAATQEAERSGCRSVELQGLHKNGSALPIEVSVGEFSKNGRRYFTCIIRDITERKHAAENISKLNDELRRANELLTIERDHEKEHVAILEELNLMKSEFVSSVSHELRTPLASIIGFAQTILIDPELPSGMQQEFLQIILEEGKRLAKLINDLLDLARIENGRVILENVEADVVPLVQKAAQSIILQADAKSIAVSTSFDEDSIVAVFDIDRMMQVMINLLSNAVKFTPDGGKVEVRARVEGGDVVIDVADTGLGIPADDIPRLFEKFFRVHRPGLDIRGTGLGLAIARHAVELQRGTLTVQSEENNGSIFTIRFPQR